MRNILASRFRFQEIRTKNSHLPYVGTLRVVRSEIQLHLSEEHGSFFMHCRSQFRHAPTRRVPGHMTTIIRVAKDQLSSQITSIISAGPTSFLPVKKLFNAIAVRYLDSAKKRERNRKAALPPPTHVFWDAPGPVDTTKMRLRGTSTNMQMRGV